MSPLEVSMATAALVVMLLDLLFTAVIYLNMKREIDVVRAIWEKTNHKVDSIKGHLDKMRVLTPMGPAPVRFLGPDGSVYNKCPDCRSKYPLHPVVRQG